jgi:hypothetical protein
MTMRIAVTPNSIELQFTFATIKGRLPMVCTKVEQHIVVKFQLCMP